MKKDVIGWTGVFFILVAYALLVNDVFDHKSAYYNVLNIQGGILLAWRVWQDRNMPNFYLEIVFIIIALIGLYKSVV